MEQRKSTTGTTTESNTTTVVVAWGWNAFSQLGDGTTTNHNTPVQTLLPAGLTVQALAAGDRHSLALTSHGVYAWGANERGQLGDGTTNTRDVPVPVKLPQGDTVAAINAGGDHNLAVTSSGEVWAWGANTNGQVGDGTTTDRAKPARVPMDRPIKTVAAGGSHSLALAASGDGTVWAWGANTFGQLGDDTTTDKHSPVTVTGTPIDDADLMFGLFAGDSHSMLYYIHPVLGSECWMWGWNHYGQLGDGTTIDAHRPVKTTFGDELPRGYYVAVGNHHNIACAWHDEEHIWGWGLNNDGQLGGGSTDTVLRPTRMRRIRGIKGLAAGGYQSLARLADEKMLAWGAGDLGQLGDGANANSATPRPVALPLESGIKVTAYATGQAHGLAALTIS